MPYDSRTYRVLIASPSDVEEEREICVRVIQQWNDLYSYTRKVVLLPLRWETHAAPEYGTRPQEVINRAIVDQCDLLVGVFWTRVGTPTGVADSGTIEEIERVGSAGKQVMLYFSKVGMDPERIDLEQLRKLNEFKKKTYPNALVETYKSQIEFRDKFARQLELKVRDVQISDRAGQPAPLTMTVGTSISIHAGNVKHRVTAPAVTDLDAVLAAEPPETRERVENAVRAAVQSAITFPITMAISNASNAGVRNLYVKVAISSTSSDLVVTQPVLNTSFLGLIGANYRSYYQPDFDVLARTDAGWEFSFEWDALQPQRSRDVRPQIFARAPSSCLITLKATVFADSFPEPVVLECSIDVAIEPKRVAVRDLIDLDQARKAGDKPKFIATA